MESLVWFMMNAFFIVGSAVSIIAMLVGGTLWIKLVISLWKDEY